MNNSLDRIHDDLVRLLRDDVIPHLADDAVRAQVFGAIFMLNNLQRRTGWALEPLAGEIRAQDALFAQLRKLAPALAPELADELPASPRLAAEVPDGNALLACRDAGNALVARLVASPAVESSGPAMALLVAYMRAELEMEMRHLAKPMFAEMSSGRSQG